MSYQWEFIWVWRNLDALFQGLLLTIALTAVVALTGLFLGALMTILRVSKRSALRWPGQVIVEIFRDLPVLVVLIWLFFCLPIVFPWARHLSPFIVAVIGLSLNFAALQSEILRAGYLAIPHGELEAAQALALTRIEILRHIIIPQVFWRSLAPTLGQFINTLKLTSLASFISVGELFNITGRLIQDTYRPLEFYTSMAVLYLLLIVPLAVFVQTIESRLTARFRHA